MRCREAIGLIVDLRDGKAAESSMRALENHLKRCEGCRAAMEEYGSACDTLQMIDALSPRLNAPEGFDARLKEAVAAKTAGARSGFFRPAVLLSGALLATVAVVMTIAFWPGTGILDKQRTVDLPLFSSTDLYLEAGSNADLGDAAEILLRGQFSHKELDAIEGILPEDFEEQISEMDDATLIIFKKQLERVNKSG